MTPAILFLLFLSLTAVPPVSLTLFRDGTGMLSFVHCPLKIINIHSIMQINMNMN